MNGSIFESVEINEKSYPDCLQDYCVFDSVSPFSPIPFRKAEAICLLNNDNVTASWNIIQLCEPTCLVREGRCDNQQVCALLYGEAISRCVCAGFTGKYCENIDPRGFYFLFSSFFSFFFFLLLF